VKPLHFDATCRDLDLKKPRVLAELHPILQAKVQQIVVMTGGRLTPYCGYRGPVEQAAALQRGASFAKFGESPHNFHPALACDLVLDPRFVEVNTVPDDAHPGIPNLWERRTRAATEAWADLEQAARDLSLERVNIGTERDWPHVQLPGWRALVGRS